MAGSPQLHDLMDAGASGAAAEAFDARPSAAAPLVSVIIPCLDEVDSVAPLTEQVMTVLAGITPTPDDFEIIFIDDGSTDGTRQKLADVAADHPQVQVITFRRNFGKAAALDAGFHRAAGAIIITLDADLQDDPAEIPKMLARLAEGFDVVSGWKVNRQDPWTKTLPSRIFNRTLAITTGLGLHDYNCGFKAYRREAIAQLNIYGELHRYIPVLLHYRGFRVTEVPVNHRPRRFGKSKYGWERFARGFFDLLTVMFLTRYATRPLHAFGGVGLVLGLAGGGILTYLTVLKLVYGMALSNRPLLFLGILLVLVGLQLVSTGLIGEMLAQSRQRDHVSYVIAGESSERAAKMLASLGSERLLTSEDATETATAATSAVTASPQPAETAAD